MWLDGLPVQSVGVCGLRWLVVYRVRVRDFETQVAVYATRPAEEEEGRFSRSDPLHASGSNDRSLNCTARFDGPPPYRLAHTVVSMYVLLCEQATRHASSETVTDPLCC